MVKSAEHRATFEPGADIDAQIADINAHFAATGWAAIAAADVQTIADRAAIVWTPEIIAAYQAGQAALAVPPLEDGRANYRASVLREADELEAAGDELGAIKKRLTLVANWPPTT